MWEHMGTYVKTMGTYGEIWGTIGDISDFDQENRIKHEIFHQESMGIDIIELRP